MLRSLAYLRMKRIEYKFIVLKQISIVFFVAMIASIITVALHLVIQVAESFGGYDESNEY